MIQTASSKLESTVLASPGGVQVELLNYGATLKSIKVPVGGQFVDVLLSYPADQDYLQDKVYFGATVGRYAGRIASGIEQVQGQSIQLVCNEQNIGHCLHGGSKGFSQQFWTVCAAPFSPGKPVQ